MVADKSWVKSLLNKTLKKASEDGLLGGVSSGVSYDNYSEDEIVIGKWIDGKPIYRKCVQNTISSKGWSNILQISTNNIDKTIRMYGGGKYDNIKDIYIPITINSTMYMDYVANTADDYIKLYISDSNYFKHLYTFIEYTKTTDASDSFNPNQVIQPSYTAQFEDYSTEEKVIGKWIDGKPLYRKIIYSNSPYTTKELEIQMTSSTSPSPYKITDNSDGSSWNAYNTNTYKTSGGATYWLGSVSNLPLWTMIDFGENKKIGSITIEGIGASYGSRSPKEFKVYSSNNGIDFIELLHETNADIKGLSKTFNLYKASSSQYRYFKLEIISVDGDSTYLGIDRIYYNEIDTAYINNVDKIISVSEFNSIYGVYEFLYTKSTDAENSFNPTMLGSTISPFRFGIDADGNYGYYKDGADTVTPFKSGGGDYLSKVKIKALKDSSIGKTVTATLVDSDEDDVVTGVYGNDKICELTFNKNGTWNITDGTNTYKHIVSSEFEEIPLIILDENGQWQTGIEVNTEYFDSRGYSSDVSIDGNVIYGCKDTSSFPYYPIFIYTKQQVSVDNINSIKLTMTRGSRLGYTCLALYDHIPGYLEITFSSVSNSILNNMTDTSSELILDTSSLTGLYYIVVAHLGIACTLNKLELIE